MPLVQLPRLNSFFSRFSQDQLPDTGVKPCHVSSARAARRGWQEPRTRGGISGMGIAGGRLTCDAHRKRWDRAAETRRAKTVALIFGGNDICDQYFDLPQLYRTLIGFAEELRAAGVANIFLFPILPRVRPRGVAAKRTAAAGGRQPHLGLTVPAPSDHVPSCPSSCPAGDRRRAQAESRHSV